MEGTADPPRCTRDAPTLLTNSSLMDSSYRGVKLSFLTGLFYYSQHPAALSHQLLAPSMSLNEAKIVVAIVLTAWSIIDLSRSINPFAPLEAIFGFLFLDDEHRSAWEAKKHVTSKSGKHQPNATTPPKPNKEKEAHSLVINSDHTASPATLRNRKKKK